MDAHLVLIRHPDIGREVEEGGGTLRAVLVDDERLAIMRLARMLEKRGDVELVGMFTRCSELIGPFPEMDVDAAFLDIDMPGMSGLELAEVLLEIKPSLSIVFVTAHNHYAREELRVKDFDYLLKPLDAHALAAVIERIRVKEGNHG